MWNGWWDEPEEGEMVSVKNSEMLNSQSYSNWYVGEPNGLTIENCGIARFDSNINGQWTDVDCNKKFCTACQIGKRPAFILRGNFSQVDFLDLNNCSIAQVCLLKLNLMLTMDGLDNILKILKYISLEVSKHRF